MMINLSNYLQRTSLIPWHVNYDLRNQTVLWNGMDTQERFNNNLGNPSTAKILKDLGWTSTSISYKFNSFGFRDDEFDNRRCGIALGCSFTQGVALKLEQTWPSILSKMLNVHVWNLGVGGASIETVFRVFEYFIKKLNPEFVCVLLPPSCRFEYSNSDKQYQIISPYDLGLHSSFAKDWLSRDSNGWENQKKSVLAMERICDLIGIPLVVSDTFPSAKLNQEIIDTNDYGRDLAQFGLTFQNYQATSMFNSLNKMTNSSDTVSIFKNI